MLLSRPSTADFYGPEKISKNVFYPKSCSKKVISKEKLVSEKQRQQSTDQWRI
jgi:hypothetical protein